MIPRVAVANLEQRSRPTCSLPLVLSIPLFLSVLSVHDFYEVLLIERSNFSVGYILLYIHTINVLVETVQ